MVPKNCWPVPTSSPEVKAGCCCPGGGTVWARAGHGHAAKKNAAVKAETSRVPRIAFSMK
jgi:hypothetical protein